MEEKTLDEPADTQGESTKPVVSPAPKADAPSDDLPCGVGDSCVPLGGILAGLAITLAAAILLLYALIAMWYETQPVAQGATAPALPKVAFLGWHFTLSREARLFAIVGISGALGGVIHTMRSLSWYVGNRYLKWSWVPFYVFLPIIAGSLATVFYLVLRAGLFSSTGTSPTAPNPYGFAALAALVGLFSEQALEKLREIFSSILTQAPAGRDTAPAPGGPNAVTGEAAVSATEVELVGTVTPNGQETHVQFVYGTSTADEKVLPVRALPASATETTLKAKVSGLLPGTSYHFRVEATNAGGKARGADKTFRTQ